MLGFPNHIVILQIMSARLRSHDRFIDTDILALAGKDGTRNSLS